MRRPVRVAAGFLLAAFAGIGAEDPAARPAVVLPAQQVVATSSLTSPTAEEAARNLAGVPGGSGLVRADGASKGRDFNLEDLLGRAPGVYLQSQNGTESAKVSVRGSGLQSDDTLGVEFLLDGLPYNEGDGEADLEDFDLPSIKYAEVYRGANALKYGGYTLGGAINLVPYTGYEAPRLDLRTAAGSFGFRSAQAASGRVVGAADYFLSLSEETRDGFRQHNREENEKVFADWGWRPGDSWENRVYFTFAHLDRQLPDSLSKGDMEADPRHFGDDDVVKQDFHLRWHYVRVADKAAWRQGERQFDAGVFWNYRDFINKDFFGNDDPTAQGIQTYHANDYGLLADYRDGADFLGAKNSFTAGFLPSQEIQPFWNYANKRGAEGALIASANTIATNANLYAENRHWLGSDRWALVTGAQLVYAKRDYRNRLASALPLGHSAAKDYRGLNPKAGLIYQASTGVQAFANFSRSFQPPSFDEMTSATVAAPHPVVFHPLNAQSAWTAEIGTRGEAGRISWDAALYRSRVSNELLELNDSQGRPLGTVNAGATIHQGLELGGEILLADGLSLKGSYLWNDFHFSGDPAYGRDRLAGIPEHFVRLELEYEHPSGFYGGPNLEWSPASYPVDQANTLWVDRYALFGFEIGYRSRGGWGFFVEAKNLADVRYPATVAVIADARTGDDNDVFNPGDGRAIYAGVSFKR